MYNIYTAAGLLWLDGLAQSPSEAVPFNLQEGPGVRYALDGHSVALWEEVFWKSLCLIECSVRWAFLFGLCWSFKPFL